MLNPGVANSGETCFHNFEVVAVQAERLAAAAVAKRPGRRRLMHALQALDAEESAVLSCIRLSRNQFLEDGIALPAAVALAQSFFGVRIVHCALDLLLVDLDQAVI